MNIKIEYMSACPSSFSIGLGTLYFNNRALHVVQKMKLYSATSACGLGKTIICLFNGLLDKTSIAALELNYIFFFIGTNNVSRNYITHQLKITS